jgi:single-stranded DNA-binding protein
MKYGPDGSVIAEITLGVGGGSAKYPVMWVKVTVWDKLAEQALAVIDKKGIAVEASGMLQVRQYEGKRGTSVAIALKNVRELRIYDRDGELVKVLSGVAKEE